MELDVAEVLLDCVVELLVTDVDVVLAVVDEELVDVVVG